MALNIRNSETEQLAAELARHTGESKTEAVTKALRDRLMRVRRERTKRRLADELEETPNPVRSGWRTWDSLPRRVPLSSSPAKTLTHRALSCCMCLSLPSGGTVRTKCR